VSDTMKSRYLEIDTHTPITEQHREDYRHLEALWTGDNDTMSVWQIRYLHSLESFGAGPIANGWSSCLLCGEIRKVTSLWACVVSCSQCHREIKLPSPRWTYNDHLLCEGCLNPVPDGLVCPIEEFDPFPGE
jgi:hypothetical protein